MNWSSEALSMIGAAPPAVQPMIRSKVETVAAEKGVDTISGQFIREMMAERHGKAEAETHSDEAELDLRPFFARETDDPLTSAFKATNDVHVFAEGQILTPEQTQKAWSQVAQEPPAFDKPRSLYIHVPFCRSRCVFCPFYANRWTDEAGGKYARTLIREIEQLADTALGQAPLGTVYFGGGTPSDLAPGDLATVLEVIRNRLVLKEDVEITLEGRISGHTPDLTKAAIDGGVNRFSLGVQSFDTALRRSLGRKAERRQVISFLNTLARQPAAVVIDLIFGLPGQSMQLWLEDLRCLHEETDVHGVDLYRLKSMPGSVMEEMITDGKLPRPASLTESAEMFAAGVETMQKYGWERLSIPHWRCDSLERSRYNSMVKSGADCIPIGCGAGGRVGLVRFFQTGDLGEYFKAIEEGKKPLASGITLQTNCDIVDRIAADLEKGCLMPGTWGKKRSFIMPRLKVLFTQWSRAGLLLSKHDGYDLTVAGQFWSVRMGSLLARLVQQSAES